MHICIASTEELCQGVAIKETIQHHRHATQPHNVQLFCGVALHLSPESTDTVRTQPPHDCLSSASAFAYSTQSIHSQPPHDCLSFALDGLQHQVSQLFTFSARILNNDDLTGKVGELTAITHIICASSISQAGPPRTAGASRGEGGT
jgi:hypothetical protein